MSEYRFVCFPLLAREDRRMFDDAPSDGEAVGAVGAIGGGATGGI